MTPGRAPLGRSARRPVLRRETAAAGLVLLLVIAAFPATAEPGGGDPFPAGELLGFTSPDALLGTTSLPAVVLCFVDVDDTGGYTLDEPVILHMGEDCSGETGLDDVRLNGPPGELSGLRIGADAGAPLSAPDPPARFWYHDAGGTGGYTPGDPVYVKLRMPTAQNVGLTDLRITPFLGLPAGSAVEAHHGDVGLPLSSLGTPKERVRLVDASGEGNFTATDRLFLMANTNKDVVSVGDVRLTHGPGRPFGTLVEHGTFEITPTVTKTAWTLCFAPHGDGAAYRPGDPLYLSLTQSCGAAVQAGDLRMSRSATAEAGSRVAASDGDHGRALSPLTDATAGTVATEQDPAGSIVLKPLGGEADTVAAHDLILTPTSRGAGTLLAPGDPLIGEPWEPLGHFQDLVAFIPRTGSGPPGQEDPVYLAPTAKTGDSLRPGDIRLTPVGDHPFGGAVGLETGEVVPKLTRQNARVCLGAEHPVDYEPGDPVYLRVQGSCPGTVQPGLLRLVGVDDHAPFSWVAEGDADEGSTLVAAAGDPQWKFRDANGDGLFNQGDSLYLDLFDPDDDEVKRGDIRTTRLGVRPAGHAVAIGDLEWGDTLVPLGRVQDHTAFVDVGSDRVVYVTKDPKSTHVLLGDARITPLRAPTVAPPADPWAPPGTGGGTGETPPAGTDPGSPADPGPDAGAGAGVPNDEPGDEEPVPGPAALLVLVAAVGAAAWARSQGARVRK